ncbi:MAG: alpha-amylase family glycosyl hydrolase [Bacteroidales bacterium]
MMHNRLMIYQVLPRLFGNCNEDLTFDGSLKENGTGKFSDFTEKALQEISKLGCNAIWYTGVIEHATKEDFSLYGVKKDNPYVVKGKAGSPYAIKDYYDVNPYLADNVSNRIGEFEQLIERTHLAGLKVIIDFVPNHVARVYSSDAKPEGIKDFGSEDDTTCAFTPNNNFYYIPYQVFAGQFELGEGESQYKEYPAKATGNDCFHAYPTVNDWYETVKLNYGVDYSAWGAKHFDPIPDTWFKMYDILKYWAEKGVDGFRCDMAEMVPVEFWGWIIPKIKLLYPELIFIAEVYNPDQYYSYVFNGKFDYLYDKVGLYDTIKGVIRGELPASSLTSCWQRLGDVSNYMLNFMENHDEQRIASPFFAGSAEAGFAGMIVSTCMSKAPFMLYFGQELGEEAMDTEGFSGQDGRTTIFDFWSVESIRHWYDHGNCEERLLSGRQKQIRQFYKSILNIAENEKAITEGLFFDLMYVNPSSEYFNQDKQYAFLRKYEDELILIVVNFDIYEQDCKVVIPKHAFDYLEIEERAEIECKELLSKMTLYQSLSVLAPFRTRVPAQSGVIWKIRL